MKLFYIEISTEKPIIKVDIPLRIEAKTRVFLRPIISANGGNTIPDKIEPKKYIKKYITSKINTTSYSHQVFSFTYQIKVLCYCI